MIHTVKSASGSLRAIAFALLLTSVTTNAEPPPPLEVNTPSDNFSQPILGSTEPRSLFSLHERQSNCYAPNRYCARYGFCCSASAGGCCQGGCASADVSECCTNGKYCTTGEKCCNGGCIPESGECCGGGGYCPQPFICVVYLSTGNRGCCTDLSCSVYYSNGATVTATTFREPSTTRRTTTATTRPDSTPVITTPDPITTPFTTSSRTSQGLVYTTYTTTIYWSYWYYFYTIYYAPSTYTTISRSTTTSTTTLTTSAQDTSDARLYFSRVSINLPTPSSAQSSPPITPTAGALVIGSCGSTSTLTLTDGNGSRTSRVISVCETVTADGSGGSRRGSGSGGSNNAATTMSAPVQQMIWLVIVSVMFSSLAMAVIL